MAWTRRKAVALAVWTVLAVGLCASAVLDRVYIPGRLKARLEGAVAAAFHRPARVRGARFSLLGGVVLEGLSIGEPDGGALLTADSVRASLRWLPLLTRRAVVIGTLDLQSPVVRVRYDELRSLSSPGGRRRAKVQRTRIRDGSCALLLPGGREVRVQGLDAELRGDGAGRYSIRADGSVAGRERPSPFRLQGVLDASGLRADLGMDSLAVSALDSFLRPLPVFLGARGIGPLTARLAVAGGRAEASVRADVRGLAFAKGDFHVRSDAVVWSDVVRSTGPGPIAHRTRVRLLSGSLEPIGALPPLDDIRGDIVLTAAGLRGERLTLSMAGLPLTLGGRMDGWSKPVFDLVARSGPVDLGELSRLRRAPAGGGLRLRGPSRFEVSMRGPAQALPSSLRGRLDLEAADLSGGFLPRPVRDLRGRVDFTEDSARWTGVAFVFEGMGCTTGGVLKGFKAPRVRAGVRSRGFSGLLEARLEGPLIRIFRLRGAGPAARFDVLGTVDRSRAESPGFALEGLVQGPLAVAAGWLPPGAAAAARRAGLAGSARFQGRAAGEAARPADWSVQGDVAVDGLSAYGFSIATAAFTVSQEGRRLRVGSLRAAGYSGTLAGEASVDFSSAPAVHDTLLVVQGLDLGQLASVPRLRGLPVNGLLDMRAQARGPLSDWRAAAGQCKLRIRGGRFFQFPLLGRLGDLVIGRKRNDIVFSDASGTLRFADGVIRSDDLRLRGDAVALVITGTLVPGGPLNLTVNTELNQSLLSPTFDILKYAVRLAGNLGILVTVHITGTTSAPVYSFLPVPIDWLKRLKELIFGK